MQVEELALLVGQADYTVGVMLDRMSLDCLTPEEQERVQRQLSDEEVLAQIRRIPPEWLRPARYHQEDLAGRRHVPSRATGGTQVGHLPPVAGTEGTGGPWPPEPEWVQ